MCMCGHRAERECDGLLVQSITSIWARNHRNVAVSFIKRENLEKVTRSVVCKITHVIRTIVIRVVYCLFELTHTYTYTHTHTTHHSHMYPYIKISTPQSIISLLPVIHVCTCVCAQESDSDYEPELRTYTPSPFIAPVHSIHISYINILSSLFSRK